MTSTRLRFFIANKDWPKATQVERKKEQLIPGH